VPLGSHPVASLDVGNELADFDDVTSKFMADHEWRFATTSRPVIPLVDVHIRAADTRTTHTNQHFVVSNGRNGNVAELETWTGVVFYE
jgi:hypothetical protein